MRHAFKILEELGAECDRLGVRVVVVDGERGSASEFLAKIVRYIEARENECDAPQPTLTDEEREGGGVVRGDGLALSHQLRRRDRHAAWSAKADAIIIKEDVFRL